MKDARTRLLLRKPLGIESRLHFSFLLARTPDSVVDLKEVSRVNRWPTQVESRSGRILTNYILIISDRERINNGAIRIGH